MFDVNLIDSDMFEIQSRTERIRYEKSVESMSNRVLIADDDQATCLILENFIRSHGLACDIVHDGSAAVEAASNRIYFLAFMDLVMPQENGDEAALRIRSIGKNNPMIVGVISNENDNQRNQCLSAGMVDVIVKPVNRGAVLRFILLASGNNMPFPDFLCKRMSKTGTLKKQQQTKVKSRRSEDSWNMPLPHALEIADSGWTLELARVNVFLREKQRIVGIPPLPSPPCAAAAAALTSTCALRIDGASAAAAPRGLSHGAALTT